MLAKAERRVDHRQCEHDIFAGVERVMLLQDFRSRHAARHHRLLDDLAFGSVRARRHAAADDDPAAKALAPQTAGLFDTQFDILARAEHKQEIGGLKDGLDQVRRIDRGNLGRIGHSPASVFHRSPCPSSREDGTMPRNAERAKSRLIALGCRRMIRKSVQRFSEEDHAQTRSKARRCFKSSRVRAAALPAGDRTCSRSAGCAG